MTDPEIHTTTNDKEVRERCREALLNYLRGVRRAETNLQIVAGIYHGFYAMASSGNGAQGAVRWSQLWNFLRRMEDNKQIVCTYDRDGRVVSVEARVK